MTIVSVVFDYGICKTYQTLAKVLEYSIKKNCSSANLKMAYIKQPSLSVHRNRGFISNTEKLTAWNKEVQKIDDDIVLLDCDMLVCGDLYTAFNDHFDIGIMQRTSGFIPYNGGVVFIKNTPYAKEFMNLWENANRKLYDNPGLHKKWMQKSTGMNQPAFLYLCDIIKPNALIKYFPCKIWDAMVEDWIYINGETKAIHLIGQMRRAIVNNNNPETACIKVRKGLKLWQQYRDEMIKNENKK